MYADFIAVVSMVVSLLALYRTFKKPAEIHHQTEVHHQTEQTILLKQDGSRRRWCRHCRSNQIFTSDAALCPRCGK